jgi:hypothetical protein
LRDQEIYPDACGDRGSATAGWREPASSDRLPDHRSESPTGYSSAGCSPAVRADELAVDACRCNTLSSCSFWAWSGSSRHCRRSSAASTRDGSTIALVLGWLGGIVTGTAIAASQSFRPIYPPQIGGLTIPCYAAFASLILNLVIVIALTPVFNAIRAVRGEDETQPSTTYDCRRRGLNAAAQPVPDRRSLPLSHFCCELAILLDGQCLVVQGVILVAAGHHLTFH